ncbi:MAG: DegV family protein, partial [Clostridiales bacterium]|nr:DegV family protein [Clostridiales bacterium]
MIKITADSTCDLSKEMVETMGITLVPLYIIVGDK